MGLSGLAIYKLLPKTNCKECGFPTCLAFAMKLAAKQATLSDCPYVSEEAKAQLDAASAPPIRLITIGGEEKKIEVGNETVLFRHEKTFYHPPGLLVRVKDTQPLDEVKRLAEHVRDYEVERVGLQLSLDGLALENTSGEAGAFAACVEVVREAAPGLPLVLMSESAATMEAGLAKADGTVPLLYAASEANWSEMASLAAKRKAPLVVRSDQDLSTLASLVQQVQSAGVTDIVLDPGGRDPAATLAGLTQLRRLAIKKNFRLLGFPVITFPGEGTETVEEETILAGQHIAKYAGFVVLDHFEPSLAYPLLTLRLNIYTDPQKPIQVTPGLYEISNPTADSPLLVTTNFSLTYFSVAGEIEGSGLPAWLLICDSEGMSVLTAWAAGKFDAERIAKSVKSMKVTEKISHRRIVIPGFVSTISGELEEELPGWEIMVGPREAIGIPAYLKQW